MRNVQCKKLRRFAAQEFPKMTDQRVGYFYVQGVGNRVFLGARRLYQKHKALLMKIPGPNRHRWLHHVLEV